MLSRTLDWPAGRFRESAIEFTPVTVVEDCAAVLTLMKVDPEPIWDPFHTSPVAEGFQRADAQAGGTVARNVIVNVAFLLTGVVNSAFIEETDTVAPMAGVDTPLLTESTLVIVYPAGATSWRALNVALPDAIRW